MVTTSRRVVHVALVVSTAAVVPLAAACSSNGSGALPDRTSSPIRSQSFSPQSSSTRSGFTRPPPATQAPPPASAAPPVAAPTGVVVTTVAPVTTAPAPAPAPSTQAATTDESTPWGWIVLAIAVAAAIVAGALLLHRRSQQRRMQAWRQQTRGAVDAAIVARGLLPAHGRDIVDLPHWESVRATADQAAAGLQTAGRAAPAPDAAAAAHTAAETLTGVTFALESSRLVQAAQPPPSAAQLADADALVQTRRAELDAALDRLQVVVEPPAESGGTAPPT